MTVCSFKERGSVSSSASEPLVVPVQQQRGSTCQPLRHRQAVRRGAACRVNVVLLRHLLVQVQQHGADTVEGIHGRGRWSAKI